MSTPTRTKPGDRGDAVRAWQTFLAESGLLSDKVDGIHGKGTEAASVAWEKAEKATKPAVKSTPIVLTPQQLRAIDGVVSVFETGRPATLASYSTVAVLPDGAGISYGKHQATDAGGALDLVCKRYVELGGRHAEAMREHLPRLAANESAKVPPKGPHPEWMVALISLLRLAGEDPIMRHAQDDVFDDQYFRPAMAHAERYGLRSALGVLCLYDTCIHSGPARVPKHVSQVMVLEPKDGGNEAAWLLAYLRVRRAWLAASSNSIVRACVYRPDELTRLVTEGNLELRLSLKVRGQVVT